LITAVGQAGKYGLYDIGWQLPAVLWDFFNTRKYWADWITTHRLGLEAARRAGRSVSRSQPALTIRIGGPLIRERDLSADASQVTIPHNDR